MSTHELEAPLREEDILKLRAGDIVYLTGNLFTLRDQGHKKALEDNTLEEGFFESNVVYHCGPIVQMSSKSNLESNSQSNSQSNSESNSHKIKSHKIISAGPTTSARMNKLTPAFIERFGVKAIIGKGGMNEEVANTLKGKAVYLAATGGCGALAAKKLQIRGVDWVELGTPEACWKLNANKFGPLIVAIDAEGKSINKQ